MSPWIRGWSALVLGAAGVAGASSACTPYVPPFSRTASAGDAPGPERDDQATLVVLWPYGGCEPGGYYTLATTDGRFLGNVAEGTQLRARLPAGEYTLLGWNVLQEEARGDVRAGPVPVLRASLGAGRTYYVRMLFGEWDDRGPFVAFRGGQPTRCVVPGMVMTSAMVAVTSGSRDWSELYDWLETLPGLVPDGAAGQRWLDAGPGAFAHHRDVAELRLLHLRDDARPLSTLRVSDGVASSSR
jgi:hypothetical protein